MAETCPACNVHVDDTGVSPGGSLRCDRCGTRFPKPKKPVAVAGKDDHALGIHPALAKRYGPPKAPTPVSMPAVDVPSPPRPHGAETRVMVPPPDGLPRGSVVGTEPGRPFARRSDEAPAPAPASDGLPYIPGYEVLELIGKGAMGRVYRARHIASRRMAAIKTLAPELAARPDFVARFEREGAAMRAVSHPGVVAVLDQGKAGSDVYYIAMEFIDGPPLRKSLERGALSSELALRYSRLILQGLAAAHEPGVIHRDLKPENILVTGAVGNERLVLVDFGLAGIVEEENDPHPNLTKSRMTMGTVNYMAPEQRTDAKRVDQRADLYAAGVILYELLTGDLPLGRFQLPTEKGLNVPHSVDRIIVKALARNAEERYQTAAEFDDDLAAVEMEVRAVVQRDTVVGRRGGDVDPGARRTMSSVVSVDTGGRTAPLASGAGGAVTLVDPAQAPAWVTALPAIRPRWVWGSLALLLGTALGLLVLRGGCLG